MSIYAVYKSYTGADGFTSLVRPRFYRAVHLTNSPEQILEHNGLRIPVGIAGNEITFFVNRAEGNLAAGYLDAGGNHFELSEREPELSRIVYELEPHSERRGSIFVIYGAEYKDEPALYIERHDRETKNFHPTSSKERE